MSDDLIKQIDQSIRDTAQSVSQDVLEYAKLEVDVALVFQKRLGLSAPDAMLKAREVCNEVSHDLQQAITDKKGTPVDFSQGIINDLLKAALPGVLDVTVSKVKEVQAEASKAWKKNHPDPAGLDPRLV